jgi:Uncharacterized conserved protein
MIQINITPEISEKFKKLLVEENNDDAVFRIRESKVGGGCKSRIELKVSLDEREDPEEESEVTVDGIPFVVSSDVIDSYGKKYSIASLECGTPGVTAD